MPDRTTAFLLPVVAHYSLRDLGKALSLRRDRCQVPLARWLIGARSQSAVPSCLLLSRDDQGEFQAASRPTPSRFSNLVDVPALLGYPTQKPSLTKP